MRRAEERSMIIRLSFAYIEPRHRFGLLTDELMGKIVNARKQFHEHIPADLAALIERYDPERFTSSASLMDNVLFGRIAYQQADASDRIRTIMGDLFDALDLYDDVLSIGLEFDVGSGGKRLTMVQRQKLNLARALLKRSDYFIFNRPLPALDQRVQDQIIRNVVQGLHEEGERPAIVWVLSNARLAEIFDRILLFNRGGPGRGRNLSGTFREKRYVQGTVIVIFYWSGRDGILRGDVSRVFESAFSDGKEKRQGVKRSCC